MTWFVATMMDESRVANMNSNLIAQVKWAVRDKTHVIWDWNGTLLSDVDHAVRTANSLLEEHQLPLIDREQYRQLFQFPVIEYYKVLGFDFSKESFESLCHKFVDRFMAGVPELPLYPEMTSVLISLFEDGRTQSILSATDQANLDAMIVHFDLIEIFRFVYGIDNRLAGSKVHRGIELIKNSGVDPQNTVLIGDTLHDLEVAQAMEIDCVLISHGHQCPTRLRQHHDIVIEV
jgi:phosphoglycolate phosphatase